MNPWNELLANLAIVAITTSLWTFGHRHVARFTPRSRSAVFGGIMACGTVGAMSLPFQFHSGVLLDLRYTFLAISGLFGGPVAAAAPFIVAVASRAMSGGTGLSVALPLIFMATASGLIAHRFIRGIPDGRSISVVSLAVVFSGTAGFFIKVPFEQWPVVMPTVVAPFALLLFVSAMISSFAISQELKRQEATTLNRIYRAIIEALPDCLNAKDLKGRFIAANPATAALMSAGTAENLIGKTDFDFYPEETARAFRADEEALLRDGNPIVIEQRFTRTDSAETWLATLKAPFNDDDGEPIGIITHNREITDRKRLESELAKTQRHLADALASMADGLAMFDRKGAQVFNNARYLELFPLTADVRSTGACLRAIIRAAIERGEEMAVSGDIDNIIERSADAILRPGDRQMRLADGRWIEARTRTTEEGGSLIVFSDISTTKRTEEKFRTLNERLEVMAHTDGLTGLLNRRAFDSALDDLVSRNPQTAAGPSLLMIDVDKFKAYNDTYGHPAGDTCLKRVANRVAEIMAPYPRNVVARYGGEEIAVIIPQCDSAAAFSVARLLCAQIRTLEIAHDGSEKGRVTVSIGTATMNAAGVRSKKELLGSADEALYAAKAAGRDCVRSCDQPDDPAKARA
ncbi:diguanylate cyclase [Neorhizobium galegae]|uniref:Putative response regulator/GGDEF domain transcriptional regulator n=1 Tax=Neorhizobium galegae bv. orientalis str. HAMBI 540 TaxID=1028800 RepID=A0A068SZM2_NEOGA|nr:diguanylate cyclase [Neorhizobium galegae]MCQ1855777.1 diguanylate cyclase [Neorhizobium galegae]CDN51652.1 Putative response regulator/GGDEF domain transcriptional regulator [Neorhizobium galegae bv. orientalis str. HAMBI 540]CDZ55522.1 Putative response regulator/GGDEF domain transcriptional regulator [Neorhizobium galegae bv. orientalis]